MEELTELRGTVETEEKAMFGFSSRCTVYCEQQCNHKIKMETDVPDESVIEQKMKKHQEQCAHGTIDQRLAMNGKPVGNSKEKKLSGENFNIAFKKIQETRDFNPRKRISLEGDLKGKPIYELFEAATYSDEAKNTIRDTHDPQFGDNCCTLFAKPNYVTMYIHHRNNLIHSFQWRVFEDIEELIGKKFKSCFTAELNGIPFIFQLDRIGIYDRQFNCFCTDLAEGFVALRDYCWSLFHVNQQKLALQFICSRYCYDLEIVLKNMPASPICGAEIGCREPCSISSFILQTFGLVNEESYFHVSEKCELDYTKFHNMRSLNIYEVTPLTPDIILTMNNKETIIRGCQFDVEQIAELLSKYRHYDCGRIEIIKLNIEGLKGEQAEEIFDKTENIIRDPDMPEEAFVRNIHSQNYLKVVIGKDLFELRKSNDSTVVKNEPIEEVPFAVKQEPIEEMESVVKNEPIEEVALVVKDEPIEEVASVVKKEPIEEVESVVKNEPIEEVPFAVKQEPIEETESVVRDEPIKAVTPSKRRRVE